MREDDGTLLPRAATPLSPRLRLPVARPPHRVLNPPPLAFFQPASAQVNVNASALCNGQSIPPFTVEPRLVAARVASPTLQAQGCYFRNTC